MINLTIPQSGGPSVTDGSLSPNITVVGVGGAGGNAVNNMIADNLQGVEFLVANTDAQALTLSRTQKRIQLGAKTTQGLGAGARPEVGKASAEEAQQEIAQALEGSNMVFITAGMGGGTGTGAAPVVARVAREMGLLTVGVVTKPFQFEGAHRMRQAESGIEELSQYVDTLIIIPNQNLFRVANEKTTFADAFKMADDVLNQGVRSVTDLMIMPGLINLDFADVSTVMTDMGRAMMGTGEASGDRRALDAAEAAIANPLLEDTCMKGAKGVLINITGGMDITLFEVDEAANRIRDEVEGEANIIFGSCFDPELEGKMRVSVVATGIQNAAAVAGNPKAVQSAMAQAASALRAPEGNEGAAKPQAFARPAAPQQPASQPTAQYTAPAAETGVQTPVIRRPAEQPTVAQRMATQARADHHGAPSEQEVQVAAALKQASTQPTEQAAPRQGSFDIPPATQPHAERPLVRRDAFIPAPAMDRPVAPPHAEEHPAFSATPRAEVRSPAAPTVAVENDPSHLPGRSNGFLSKLLGGQRSAPSEAETVDHGVSYREAPTADGRTSAALSVDPQDRPAPRREDDELEIPAFLRRQAN